MTAPRRRGKKPGTASPAQSEASRRNGKLVAWQPEIRRKEVSQGVFKEETTEEAWNRTRTEVSLLAAIGYPHEHIARLVRPAMSEDTLRKYFQHELDNGRLERDAKVAGVGYFMATSGRHPDMTRFWLRARLGWRDHGDIPSGGMEVRFTLIDGDDW